MHKRRRLFQKHGNKKESGNVSLQITSMADIFTILLVFLLKGISSDALAIAPSQGTKLPTGVHTDALSEPALQVELGKTGILIEKDFISAYNKFDAPLRERLTQEREKQKLISAANDSVKNDGRVLVLSDESVPFNQLKGVLRILSETGYSDVKFGVIKE